MHRIARRPADARGPFRSLLPAGLAALAAASSLTLGATPARAQDAIQGEFSVQRFNPAPGPRNFVTTRGVRTDGEMVWSAGLVVNYAYKPFVVRSCLSETDCDSPSARNPRDVNVIENLLTGDFMGSLTPIPRLQLGLRVPVTWVKGVGITEQGTDSRDGINAVGMGDAELEAKYRLYGDVKSPFVVGAGAFVSAPLGNVTAEGNYIGDSTPTVGIRGIFDGEQKGFSFGGNLVGIFRGEGKVGTTDLGPEFRYGIGAGYRVSPVFRVLVDGAGSTRFTANRGENTLEAVAGLQINPLGSPLQFTLGGGTGIVEGVGVPTFRGFLSVMVIVEGRDRDGDGIDDGADQCPTEPEDKDNYEDADGCPDPDNDLDSILDAQDKCPSEPEDQDGFEDTDGCPDPDNDKDGIPDTGDRCPNEPETKNGFKDEDGCPDEADSDNDGVPDSRDACPNEPEDTDGHEDTDGCPDPDNDNDGIPDDQDECGDEPETMNGFQDEDGCPDEDPKAKKK